MSKKVQLKKRGKRYDLPLYRGSGGHLVTWVTGVMTYLMVLALVLIFGLNALQHYWQQGLTGHMTVEIPYNAAPQNKIDQLVTALDKLDGLDAKQLTQDDIAGLVGSWLGDGAQLADLPLPSLVDITRAENAADAKQIEKTITRIIPSATLDTHQEWLAELLKLAKACRMLLIGIAIVLALTTALTVAATAHTRLALHKDEVDLLHLIGATDSYIATQFQRQAFRLATEGAAIGLFGGLITLILISLIKRSLGDTLIPGLSLSWVECICLLLTPVLAGAIAMGASRLTVLRALKKMP